jgi:hypothetical protein
MTARSNAHVIPQSVGGVLFAACLCKRCNSEMGRMEALLAKDMIVRRLVKYQLQGRLPAKLADSLLKGEAYFTDHETYGRVDAWVDESGELQPKASSTIKGDADTLNQALAALDRSGATERRKEEFRREFEEAGSAEWIDVMPGYRIHRLVDWSGVSFKESLTDPLVGHEVPLGIAYLYLALCIGQRIYEDTLSVVRDALRSAIEGNPAQARAYLPPDRSMRTDAVEPQHLLRAKSDGQGTTVVVQIFRSRVWPVHFSGARLDGEQTLYVIDLERGEERWCSKVPD